MSNKDKSHVEIEGQYVNFRFVQPEDSEGRKSRTKAAYYEAHGEDGWSVILKTSSYKEAKRMVTKQLKEGSVAAREAANADYHERLAALRKQTRSARPLDEYERSEGRDLVEGYRAYDLE